MSSRFLGNSMILNHVYINSTGITAGRLEHEGPLSSYFDKDYEDYYCNQDSFEKAERTMIKDALNICLDKVNLKQDDIDLFIGGDLMNQNTIMNYLARDIIKPFIGIYSACSSFCLSMALGSLLIEGGFVKKVMSLVSSHNLTAERQFRYPVEYGGQKKITSTFTATGGVATLLSSDVNKIRVESITLGRVIDYKQNDPNDMGRAMAPAAYDTLTSHFKDLNRTYEDYDLIVTGDLSTYGHEILEAMLKKDDPFINNYHDCGCMLYDVKNQPVFQGGSGCACSAMVSMGFIYNQMLKGTYKKVLIVATGALLSPLILAQKETIPCVAHGIVLEVV